MGPRIVVGVGATTNAEVLQWAIDETIQWDGRLLIVHSFEDAIEIELPHPMFQNVEREQAILDEAATVAQNRRVATDLKLCDGPPGRALVEFSKGAKLLVLGPTRRGRASQVLRTSVTQYCIQHSYCPVTIVNSRL
jgi:nucleotide-binding universal stress UspA family protein